MGSMADRIEVRSAVVLYSEDPERLAAFYRDTLGFPLEPDGIPPSATGSGSFASGSSGCGIDFECELGTVSFAVRAAAEGPDDVRERIGAVVLSLAVADLDAYLSALRQEGVEADGPLALAEGGRGARLRDPDGNELELVEAEPEPVAHRGARARIAGWLEVLRAPPLKRGN
jgi:catechol 2,3-dioxygenase-like lactoylglutathione lyase family enzyme